MSHNFTSRNLYSSNQGLLPRPPTASNPVWQHLLHSKDRAPTSLSDIASVAPPVGPLDKNATSMRILLHDTQSNFEKFGKHVGELFDEIKDCKLEMKTMHSLFERDREGLMGDIIDLVNRSQKECQKSIGAPAQCQPVETFFKDVEHRLGGIDHKLDAIQSFNQTHGQALQTQIQAVQLLLDKQTSIIAAVSPLLPLLQALPLHIDTVKASLNDTLERCTITSKENPKISSVGPGNTDLSTTLKRPSKRKWPVIEQSPSTSSTTPRSESPLHKKSRKEDPSKDVVETTKEPPSRRSILNDNRISPRGDSSAAIHGGITAQALSRKNNNNAYSTTRLSGSPSDPTTSISSRKHGGVSTVPKFATPRRPLTDLPVLHSGSSRGQRNKHLLVQRQPTREMSLERSNTLAAIFPSASGNLRRSAPTPIQPPRILRVHTSLANCSNAPYATIDSLENLRTYAASSSGEGLLPSDLSGLPQSLSIKGETANVPLIADSSESVAPSAIAGLETLSAKSKTTFGRQKDRRSPIRDGRRFIPLVDSEDEEENIT